MRICSLLPSATEIVFALGLGDRLVGISHACDYPPEARSLPVLTESLRSRSPAPGTAAVHAASLEGATHGPSYAIREDLLRRLRPELVLTQDICDVCAIGSGTVFEVCSRVLDYTPEFVTIRSAGLEDILQNILEIGRATQVEREAAQLVGVLRVRIDAVRAQVGETVSPQRVLCLEWARPPIAAGLWIPEMVAAAGGIHGMSKAGERARRITFEQVVEYDPEVLMFMPCGWDLDRARAEFSRLRMEPGWADLPALRRGAAYRFDGRVPSRHGPRTVDVLEALSEILHPKAFPARWAGILYEVAQ